ncbi:hypothetical protein AMECASPLE_037571 [Ameca splendens]|uniref:Uncharacterized protein n=1 Tax=Ameca splendens TaxID=208324 RepID=A0ABV0ZGQ7_9TELE
MYQKHLCKIVKCNLQKNLLFNFWIIFLGKNKKKKAYYQRQNQENNFDISHCHPGEVEDLLFKQMLYQKSYKPPPVLKVRTKSKVKQALPKRLGREFTLNVGYVETNVAGWG